MKKFVVLAGILASLSAFPAATPVLASSANSALCGPDAPEGYKRPGGYCSQLDSTESLHPGKSSDCVVIYGALELRAIELNQILLVAEPEPQPHDPCKVPV